MAPKVSHKRKGIRSPMTKPISASTMGKALVLLATTCAALSTRRHAPTKRGFQVSTHKSRSDHTTVLYYRDLDEHHAMNAESIRAAAASMDVRVSTPTAHRAITSKSQPLDDDQTIMDEYLEYVERRYSRMHKHTSPVAVQPSHFSPGKFVLSTLVYSSSSSSPSSLAAARADNEALQALGLTGLASERLRQRLQAPREFRNEHESAVNFFQYFTNAEKFVASTAELAGGRLAPHVSLSFLAQFKLLIESFSKFIKAYVTSLKVMANFAVRVVPAILERGGLRHSVRFLSVATVAVLLMFRPLLKGFMKQA
ncbi:hypothetical protein HJC23_004965 [Cyclotella cryptica]|uniref:Uncharacterized protein n=1 Tax=Cyclotella cryptica TaxID=29204 RepID=A0ABD3P8X8_9STRA|eukprot:CCRYP_016612-RA/>CCRYP_016612-RA protein AED:0.28 eAED:0.28 QI:0/-1/0/1/-1/1/1/0/310